MRTIARLLPIAALAAGIAAAVHWQSRTQQPAVVGVAHLPFLANGWARPAAPEATATEAAPATTTAMTTATTMATAAATAPAATASPSSWFAGRWTYLTYTDGIARLAVDAAGGRVWAVGWGGVVAWDVAAGTSRAYTLADGLPSLRISSVAVAGDGTVWVGTRGAGAARLGGDGAWHALSFGDGPWDDDVLAIAPDPDGSVWFGTGAGASRLRPDGTVIHYRSARGEVAGMVTGIAIDGAGNRWFGTYYSGLSVMRADGRWETFKAAAGGGLSYDLVIDVNVDRDGRVWVLSGGLPSPSAKAFEPAVDIVAPDGRWTALDVTGWVDIDDGLLRAVAFDARGEAWFAADNGILAPDGPGRWKRLPAADGPAAGGVSHVVFDAAGDLWAATGGGLSRRSPDGAWRTYRRGDLPTSNVNAIAVDAEGTAWLGTAGGGLVRRAPDGTWRAYTTDDGLIGNGVFSVAVDPTGGVWFSSGGTTDNEDEGGVHHLAADGRLTRFGRADGLPSSSVGDIVVDAEGNAWFATSTYFYGPNQRRDGRLARRAADGTWTSFSRDDGLPRGGDVRALALDADGGLWVGSDVNQGAPTENLSHRALDGVWERVPLPGAAASYYISALTFDHAGNLWVGNWDGVLRRAPDGRWTTRADDPALNFQASAIAVDAAGALWFSAAPGTVRVLHPDGAWETITEADGLAPATIEAIAVGLDGRMWFAGREGGVSILAPAADGRQP